MRVAVNVEQLLARSPGGVGRYSGQLATLLARLAPTDEIVPLVARHPAALVAGALREAGITGAPVAASLPRSLLYESWNRWGAPRPRPRRGTAPFDLVHAPSLAVPGRGSTPLVVTVHDAAAELWPDAFTARGREFHRRGAVAAARRADLVIAVSAAAADEIVARTPIPSDRIRVVHHAVVPPDGAGGSVDVVTRRYGLAPRGYVLWVGSLEPRKGVGTLVAAMARLHRAGATAVPLVLAGFEGWLSAGVIDPADRAALGPALVTVGRVPERELWSLYAGAALLALPSRHEGFGLPVLEAMSQGTAVVCSDLPALREVAGSAAAYVPATDVSAWAETIAGLLADDGGRAALAALGPARAATFSARRFVDATRSVYREATGS